MWHRRVFTGRPGRLFSGRPRQILRRAFRLMENGQHAEAAELFEQLARSALDLGMTERAPYLFLQAALARFLSDQPEMGMALAQEGLQILANAGRWEAVNRLGNRITDELERMGLPDQSIKFSTWLSGLTQGKHVAAGPSPAHRLRLPTVCPQCSATVRPDEVEWIDDRTAECAYCGSVLTSE